MTRQSNGGEDRLDRAERLLEQLIERQLHNDNRLDRTKNAIERIDALILRNAQLIERNAQQISVLVREMGFLRAAVQGHISQSSPPVQPE